MKTDLYTKTILTVIAVCLTIIVIRQLEVFPEATAEGFNKNYGLVPLNDDGSINVKIKPGAETLNVSIVDINTYDKLKVDVADISTSVKMKVDVADVSTSDEMKINLKTVDYNAFFNCTVPVKTK